MTAREKRSQVTLAALLLLLAAPLGAQTSNAGSFVGNFQVGYQGVDVNGSEEKFRSDLNLRDTPMLFSTYLDYQPGDALQGFADRIELDLSTLGDTPFETLRLDINKYGRYDFHYERRKSDYFYDDLITRAELVGGDDLSILGDQVSFDFERVRDLLDLDIRINRRAKFNLGFDRYTRQGDSTNTVRIQRTVYQVQKPLDERQSDYIAGFEYAWDKVTLILEERYRDYENAFEIFLPGQSGDSDPVLDFFFLDQPYDFTSNDHTLRVVAQPTRKLLIRFAGTLQDLGMDIAADERVKGTDGNGVPYEDETTGDGQIDRDMELLDLDLTYQFTQRWGLILGARSRTLDQNGAFQFGDGLNSGLWKIDTTSYDAGVQFAVSPQLVFSGGFLGENRDVEVSEGEDEDLSGGDRSTDHLGWYVTAAWKPTQRFKLSADFDDSSIDDPFAAASPTSRQHARLRLRYGWENGFWVSGAYTLNDIENSDSNWKSDFDQADVRVGYNGRGLDAHLGYNTITTKSESGTLIGRGNPLPFRVLYDVDSDFVDGRVRWVALERLVLGGDLRLYENSGFYARDRSDYRGWVEILFGQAYWAHLGYRSVDYNEDFWDVEDYDADIVELSIGYRW